ncbi:hypothetical protein GEOBRER4_n1628 [Citrifermentans bremense]|uniref:Peptidase C14 caspase domain-containing protein n=1 Tax=Citrifermentans bremense TaxID=60035 RepID=A0A6S6M556_9BACT|nr:caspase family protein [Citrifermentans bremense]BCG46814.1 hypothetical protein GEOBRER4_n1628 [Citrifermentans bremense]
MGKKIAILIGVSKYDHEVALPPCENDLRMVTDIIKGASKYDDYIVIGNSPKGSDAKSDIATFIRKYQSQKIEEVFFYYTGHGTRYSGDFLFVFSDFVKDKIEQTSLRNSELDSMLKSLSPALAIKVVDACQAGTEYIKSVGDLEDIFKKSATSNFDKTYFFFSCTSSENSVAVKDYSLFTKSFADAIVSYSGKTVRYRDLMAFISDDKAVTSRQTPLFIQQAHNIEVFCEVSDDLIKAIKGSDENQETKQQNNEAGQLPAQSFETRLVETIKTKAIEFCSEQEAQMSLSGMVDTVTAHDFGDLLKQLYDVNIEIKKSYNDITGIKAIGSWLSEEKEPYFAKVTYTEEEYEAKERVEIQDDYSDIYAAISVSRMFGRQKKYEYKTVTKYRDVVDGLQLTAPAPCNAIEINLVPKEQNISWYKAFIVFVFSKSKLAIFYKYEKENEVSWNQRETLDGQQWKTIHCNLKNTVNVKAAVVSIMNNISESIISELSSTFDVSQ